MPLHHCGSLFERLLAAGTPTGVPPPPLPNAELHTAQSLERELRGKEKVIFNNKILRLSGASLVTYLFHLAESK